MDGCYDNCRPPNHAIQNQTSIYSINIHDAMNTRLQGSSEELSSSGPLPSTFHISTRSSKRNMVEAYSDSTQAVLSFYNQRAFQVFFSGRLAIGTR